MKYTTWQKDGIFFIIMWLLFAIISAFFENIYFELIFIAFFIVAVIALRLNIEIGERK